MVPEDKFEAIHADKTMVREDGREPDSIDALYDVFRYR